MSLREATPVAVAMESQQQEKLINVQEAAQILCVSVSTLYGWVWQRRIPFIKIGRALRFRPTDLRCFIAENRIEARAHNVV
jgi:excisionase family DNA binding protein